MRKCLHVTALVLLAACRSVPGATPPLADATEAAPEGGDQPQGEVAAEEVADGAAAAEGAGAAAEAPAAPLAAEEAPPPGEALAPVPLPPGADALGVHRDAPVALGEGQDHDVPAVTVTADGTIFTAFVTRTGRRERIDVRSGPSLAALGEARTMSRGPRAWRPALAAGPEGAVWLVWCGRTTALRRGDHDRQVFLRRLAPGAPGPVRVVSEGKGRHCDPDVAVDPQGGVHVAFESAPTPGSTGIAYRAFGADGRPSGLTEAVSTGPFARRPAIAAHGDAVHVAWDALVSAGPTGAEDPDYDLFLSTRGAGAWSAPQVVDAAPGIQAGADLAVGPSGEVLVAYHSSARWGLVKWWTLRRIVDGRVEALAAADPGDASEPQGEMQGAEFPALAVDPAGRIRVVTRPSQGAFLHLADAGGISAPLNLTRLGWGARGQRASVALAPDGALLVARRARAEAILERFTFPGAGVGPPRFVAAESAPKPQALLAVSAPRPLEDAPAPYPGRYLLLGDVHMHSAVSDGTGAPDEILARSWERGLDFAVLTDHDYVVGSRMALSEHDEIAFLSDLFDARPGFTTLNAYEWTTPPLPGGHGHRNVYFQGDAPLSVYGFRDGYADTLALNAALRKERAFTAPHHTAWTGTDWQNVDPKIQRHFEVVSVHGAFERPASGPIPPRGDKAGMFAVDGIAAGHRFGFLGGTDGHGLLWHHGIGRRRDPWLHGLTGVLAARPDRGALWQALHDRMTYATSGAPLIALLSAGGVPMGSEGKGGKGVTLEWHVEGTERLVRLELIRDGQTLLELTPEGPVDKGRFVDEDAGPGAHAYWLRAQQGEGAQDADLAWTSPIWITGR